MLYQVVKKRKQKRGKEEAMPVQVDRFQPLAVVRMINEKIRELRLAIDNMPENSEDYPMIEGVIFGLIYVKVEVLNMAYDPQRYEPPTN